MKRILFGFAPMALLATMAFSPVAPVEPLTIGSSLPKAELKMKDVSGKEVSINDVAKENGVLVMFSCNTCPYVVKNQSRTAEACTYAMSKDFGVII